VFSLRSQCAALAEKILVNSIIGSALTKSQNSRYDPRTNRCYVELTIQKADLSAPDTYLSKIQNHGHTNETLAFALIKGGTKTGSVFVKAELTSVDPFDGANDYINRTMEDVSKAIAARKYRGADSSRKHCDLHSALGKTSC
jgi:hypothetical protein